MSPLLFVGLDYPAGFCWCTFAAWFPVVRIQLLVLPAPRNAHYALTAIYARRAALRAPATRGSVCWSYTLRCVPVVGCSLLRGLVGCLHAAGRLGSFYCVAHLRTVILVPWLVLRFVPRTIRLLPHRALFRHAPRTISG